MYFDPTPASRFNHRYTVESPALFAALKAPEGTTSTGSRGPTPDCSPLCTRRRYLSSVPNSQPPAAGKTLPASIHSIRTPQPASRPPHRPRRRRDRSFFAHYPSAPPNPQKQQVRFLKTDTSERRPGWRSVHEPDPHMPIMWCELLRLPGRAAASRPGTGRPPRGMDAVELSRDSGTDCESSRSGLEL